MGLDMYLLFEKDNFDGEYGYWRKAYQIHGWFVRNVQDGVDDSGQYEVSEKKLRDLLELCQTVLKTKNSDLLPPTEGFFFGSRTVDDDYWQDLRDTIGILEDALRSGQERFYYCSSW